MSATDLYRSIPGSLWAILTDWLSIDRRRSPSGAFVVRDDNDHKDRRGVRGIPSRCDRTLPDSPAGHERPATVDAGPGHTPRVIAPHRSLLVHRRAMHGYPGSSATTHHLRRLPAPSAMHAPQSCFLIYPPSCRVFSAEFGCRKFEVSTSTCQKSLQWYWLALPAGDPRLGSYGCAAVSSNEKWSKILQTVINVSFFVDNCGAESSPQAIFLLLPARDHDQCDVGPRRGGLRSAGPVS